MAGDYSRNSFDSLRDYAGLFFQQGHPTLDADWNEWVALVDRRIRAGTIDMIGRATVPRETPNGFAITTAAGPKLAIGRGRIYVDGLLAECHGRIDAAHPPAFDRERTVAGRALGVLDEAIGAAGSDSLDYLAQPYWPHPDPLPGGAGTHLVYLDLWRREVTALKDPRLLDPALGGIDTATRWQTIWQVRLLANIGAGATCGSDIPAWDALTLPSPARLTTATVEFDDPDEPCLIPPGGGYRGLENQLYRVEIHSGGVAGAARFKWSRDNGSVGATIESFADAGRVTVRRIGRDAVLRFETNDWVEVTDDRREFAGRAGDMRRVVVEPDTNELRFDTPLSADLVPSGAGGDTPASRHSRVIKWDQSGQILLPDGSVWHDLDASGSDGLIPIPADGRAIMLEAGITVSLTSVAPARALRALDHWSFAARTEGAAIEPLAAAPPDGLHHHYARLGVVTFPSTVVDCRSFWPPESSDDGGCGCTLCVEAEAHNNGTFTLQQAVNQLPAEGGTICLGPGDFQLGDEPVILSGRRSTRLKGHGAGTQLIFVGSGNAAIDVHDTTDVLISDLAIAAVSLRDGEDVAAIRLTDVVGASVERVAATAVAAADGFGRAVLLDGYNYGTTIEACQLSGDIGVGVAAAVANGTAGYVALFETRIAGSAIIATRHGIMLDGAVFHLGTVLIAHNLISAGQSGIIATGFGIAASAAAAPSAATAPGAGAAPSEIPVPPTIAAGASVLRIHANEIGAKHGHALICSLPEVRISDNILLTAPAAGPGDPSWYGIRLTAGRLGELRADVQLTGNHITGFGYGVVVEGRLATLLAERNLIRDCGLGGIAMTPDAAADRVIVADNHLERIAGVSTTDGAAAVLLSAVDDARLVGNHIATVGAAVSGRDGRPDYWAGIELHGVLAATLSDNLISGLGTGQTAGIAIGIIVIGPFTLLTIHANQIYDTTDPVDGGRMYWCGIHVILERGEARLATDDLRRTPALVRRGDRLLALSTLGARAVGTLGLPVLGVTGNQIADTHPRSLLPLVHILTGTSVSSLQFTGNQCRLQTAGEHPDPIVELEAERVDASHNVVRRDTDTLAMAIRCATRNKQPNAIVIGNLTYGAITINGGSVPAPFAALNILS